MKALPTESEITEALENAILRKDISGVAGALSLRAALPLVRLTERFERAEAELLTWRQRLAWCEAQQAATERAMYEHKERTGRYLVGLNNQAQAATGRLNECRSVVATAAGLPAKFREVIRFAAIGDQRRAQHLTQEAETEAVKAQSWWEVVESTERNAGRGVPLAQRAAEAA